VERNWFRRVLAAEQAPPIYDPQADPDGPDGGFDLAQGATLADALATWRAEIARAREHCADRALADTGRFMDQDVSLRGIYVHMIEEYARHNGHADLLRERIDGTTGVRMREECGLDGAESGPLVVWAVKVLEQEIRAGHLPEPTS
jgi:Protein of unknown function (DUF664)